MAIDMKRARALCGASELALIRAATRLEIGKLTPARLRSKIARARKLRDKARDLGRSQRREVRGKAQPSRTAPTRDHATTLEKVALFEQAIDSFEKRLAGFEQPTRPTRASTAAKGARRKTTHKKERKSARRAARQATKAANVVATPATKAVAKPVKAPSRPRASARATPAGQPTQSQERPVAPATPKPPSKASIATTASKASTFAKTAPPDLRARTIGQRAHTTRSRAHASSRGRRSQGRRDSR